MGRTESWVTVAKVTVAPKKYCIAGSIIPCWESVASQTSLKALTPVRTFCAKQGRKHKRELAGVVHSTYRVDLSRSHDNALGLSPSLWRKGYKPVYSFRLAMSYYPPVPPMPDTLPRSHLPLWLAMGVDALISVTPQPGS